jgi:hypothetical protein
MLKPNDERWRDLQGGYRMQFDPRPLLAKLEAREDLEETWHELWGELHHQGDVGDASYVAATEMVRIYRQHSAVDWNTYGIVAVIELVRGRGKNPEVPDWLKEEYFGAIAELAEIGKSDLTRSQDPEEVRTILGVLALAKGLRTHARFLVEYSGEELLEFESRM